MKNIVTVAGLFLGAGVSAQAQIAFSGMEVSVDAIVPVDPSADIVGYSLNGQAIFTSGALGFQVDFGAGVAVSGGGSTIESYDAALHVFGTVSDRVKLGGFVAYDNTSEGFGPKTLTYGAEGLLDFGNLDTEFSIARTVSPDIPFEVAQFSANAYYQISAPLTANIGWTRYFFESSPLNVYTIGVDYQFANLPMSVGVSYLVSYTNGVADGDGAIAASVSYSFGPQSDERAFGKRGFNFLNINLVAL